MSKEKPIIPEVREALNSCTPRMGGNYDEILVRKALNCLDDIGAVLDGLKKESTDCSNYRIGYNASIDEVKKELGV